MSLRHKAINAGGDSGIDGHYRYLRSQLVRLLAGINDRQVFELQIRERNTHRGCERRRIHPFDLYAETAAALEQQQIEFGALMCGPKIGPIGFNHFENFLGPTGLIKRTKCGDPSIAHLSRAMGQLDNALQ